MSILHLHHILNSIFKQNPEAYPWAGKACQEQTH